MINKSTRATTAVLGVIFGISGFFHGIFETLQGNYPTPGIYINAIGPQHQMWPHGTEPAITLIPNYLYSGIASILIGLALIIWSIGFVQRRHGSNVLLLLFITLLLVGGGVAQIIFIPFIWLLSTRIRKPLVWWEKKLPQKFKTSLSKLWPACISISAALLSFALLVAVTGYVPFVSNPDTAVIVMMVCLFVFLLTQPLTFLSAFARDLVNPQDTG